ncbi:MAG: 7-cyano-7-deazaguanine synthase QueC [Candidatus Margulisbacteria bacterium GWF2_35_9]|nr:MAG: 7-cyano-7-deazaguanine synthase QueC [Candidatus Margulisbacteria bacterium GWF2_35_9]
MQINDKSALVILSGGQDSTTALFWAKQQFMSVETISFDYGQRHKIELDCAKKIASIAEVPNKRVSLSSLSQLSDNAMVNETNIELNKETSLPTTFVPGRNLLFVTMAAAFAYEKRIPNLILGVSQVDYSGYPDCREETMKSLEKTISLGMEFPFKIHTPLIHKTKRETVLLAKELGIVDVLKFTHTCYKGQNPPCGDCPACELRAKGFAEVGINDPLIKSPFERGGTK